MALTTAQREERIAAAIDDFYSHEGAISVWKIALKHKSQPCHARSPITTTTAV
jgi:hypothetical protein